MLDFQLDFGSKQPRPENEVGSEEQAFRSLDVMWVNKRLID